MPAPQYSRSLSGLTLNLLLREIERALPFHREVLQDPEPTSEGPPDS